MSASAANMGDADRCGLLGLPSELKNAIIVQLPDARSVFNLALTSRIFYNHIFHDDNGSNERQIAASIVEAEVGVKLLPMAIVRYQASIIPWGQPAYGNAQLGREGNMIDFLDEHMSNLQVTRLPIKMASLSVADNLLTFHEMIRRSTTLLSTAAANDMPSHRHQIPLHREDHIIPNNREEARFSKALYIYQSVYELFPRSSLPRILDRLSVRPPGEELKDEPWVRFWLKFAPWEVIQVQCIVNLMKRHSRSMTSISAFPKLARTNKAIYINCSLAAVHRTMFEFSCLSTSDTGTLNVNNILRRFPEEDLGPASIWFHTLVQSVQPPEQIQDTIFQGNEGFLKCTLCLMKWGYPFWDHQSLDQCSCTQFPTMNAMEVATRTNGGYHVFATRSQTAQFSRKILSPTCLCTRT